MSCVMIKTQSILSRWRVYVFHLMQFCPCSSFLLEMKCSSPIMFTKGKTLDHNYDSNIQLNQLIILYSLFMEGKGNFQSLEHTGLWQNCLGCKRQLLGSKCNKSTTKKAIWSSCSPNNLYEFITDCCMAILTTCFPSNPRSP